jgi:23S rRNA pseudouridine1911/1915/1917 synthase
MVKVSSNDVVAILRKFEVAGDENVPRHVSMLQISNPSLTNTLVSFRFAKQQYYVLYDDTGDDDLEFVVEQIRSHKQDVIGDVIKNPNDHETTYALPFRGKEVYLFAVKSPKTRLDLELSNRYPELSRSTWQKHVKAGHVSVNGDVQISPKADILASDVLAVSIPDAIDFSQDSLPIVYIDDNVIVINKPVGILSHSKGAMNDEFTVAGFFARYSTYNADTNRPGIVHRLDRDTSGIMIGARNEQTATLLQKQFADRKTKKTYLAIVDGIPKSPKAQIDLPIGRNPSAPSTFRVDVKGKAALTKYEVIAENDHDALVKLYPRTGRTHQLRVHMKYINTPIKGDKVYGKPSDRLYLHAESLEITIPESTRMTFEAPIPQAFIDIFPQAK